jgi:hypothetical protein
MAGRGRVDYNRSEGEGPLLTYDKLKGDSSLPFPTASYIAAAGPRKSGYLSNLPKYPKANMDTYLTCQIS